MSYAKYSGIGGGSSLTIPVSIADGGTGQTTAFAAINALMMLNTTTMVAGTGASTNSGITTSVILGYQAGAAMTTTSANVAIGYQALNAETTSTNNTAIGYKAGALYTGKQSVLIGDTIMGQAGSGERNTYIGSGSCANGGGGLHNSGVGYLSLGNNSGNNCVALGYAAGNSNSTGGNLTLIGCSADVTTTTLTNASAFGYNTTVSTSNTMILGNGVNVGIDSSFSTTATARLSLPGGTATAGTAPLKIHSGTNLTSAEAGAIESDGTHLYWTSNTPTRYQLDQQGGLVSPWVSLSEYNQAYWGGNIPFLGADSATADTDVFIGTEDKASATPQNVNIGPGSVTGLSTTAAGAYLNLIGGNVVNGSGKGGDIDFNAGTADSGKGGNINMTAGTSNTGAAGTINAASPVSYGKSGNGTQTVSAGNSILSSASFTPVTATGAVSTSTTTPIVAGLVDGQILQVINVGANTITIKSGGNTKLPGAVDYALAQYGAISFIWSAGLTAWVTTSASAN